MTKLIVALDTDSLDDALTLVDAVGDAADWFKVGKQLFTRVGPEAVTALKARGKRVFLDLKFHDIPNTVGQAVRSAAAAGADMTNVHAAGGSAMLAAAATAGADTGVLTLAVTVLTSLDAAALRELGIEESPATRVVRLARLAHAAGIGGVVCSALEIAAVRDACGLDFALIVPGIRPVGSARGDQKRVMTPVEAARAGADYIVVGRPITQAEDPASAAGAICKDLQSVTG